MDVVKKYNDSNKVSHYFVLDIIEVLMSRAMPHLKYEVLEVEKIDDFENMTDKFDEYYRFMIKNEKIVVKDIPKEFKNIFVQHLKFVKNMDSEQRESTNTRISVNNKNEASKVEQLLNSWIGHINDNIKNMTRFLGIESFKKAFHASAVHGACRIDGVSNNIKIKNCKLKENSFRCNKFSMDNNLNHFNGLFRVSIESCLFILSIETTLKRRNHCVLCQAKADTDARLNVKKEKFDLFVTVEGNFSKTLCLNRVSVIPTRYALPTVNEENVELEDTFEDSIPPSAASAIKLEITDMLVDMTTSILMSVINDAIGLVTCGNDDGNRNNDENNVSNRLDSSNSNDNNNNDSNNRSNNSSNNSSNNGSNNGSNDNNNNNGNNNGGSGDKGALNSRMVNLKADDLSGGEFGSECSNPYYFGVHSEGSPRKRARLNNMVQEKNGNINSNDLQGSSNDRINDGNRNDNYNNNNSHNSGKNKRNKGTTLKKLKSDNNDKNNKVKYTQSIVCLCI